jgi:hypothetical protein
MFAPPESQYDTLSFQKEIVAQPFPNTHTARNDNISAQVT